MSVALQPLLDEVRQAVEALPSGLRDHVLRVEEEALRLADMHALDAQRLRLAALSHDLVRHQPDTELLDLAGRYGIEISPVERASPILLHGPIAACILRDLGCDDREVLAAVDCHTTARAGMTALEQALFVADKVEPAKLRRHPEYAAVRDAAEDDLQGAVLLYLDLNLQQALRKGWLLHPHTLEARNELLLQRKQQAASQHRPPSD